MRRLGQASSTSGGDAHGGRRGARTRVRASCPCRGRGGRGPAIGSETRGSRRGGGSSSRTKESRRRSARRAPWLHAEVVVRSPHPRGAALVLRWGPGGGWPTHWQN